MAMRVKNISEGWVDATGFHPIRAASDYKASRAGEKRKYAPGKKAAAKRKAAAEIKTHTRRKAKKSVAEIKKMLAPKSAAGKRVVKAKNPKAAIPKSWTKAKVKRLANGDIQLMLT